jgi:glycosyltransferase involved in cell wall biosynthesis
VISFIVPAHNEERYLGGTLHSIRTAAATFDRPYEIIVVDDASSDATASVAASHGARVVPVSLRQIAAVRNAGARVASGRQLFFVDADTVVSEAVLRAAVTALDRGDVGGGASIQFEGRLPLWARLFVPRAIRFLHSKHIAGGCFFFCRRDAFEVVGGFDESLYASEEITLSFALGRLGAFRILDEPVLTSGRKLRSYSGLYHLWVLVTLLARGPSAIRKRAGLELWYEGRRDDPDWAPTKS